VADLGDGIVTPGVDDSPNKLSALGMPADLSGKSARASSNRIFLTSLVACRRSTTVALNGIFLGYIFSVSAQTRYCSKS
jgi:hypothetical protein